MVSGSQSFKGVVPQSSVKGGFGGGSGRKRQSLLNFIGTEEKAVEEETCKKNKDKPVGFFVQELQAARRAVVDSVEVALEELSKRLKLAFQEELAAARDAVRLDSIGALLDMAPQDVRAMEASITAVATQPAAPVPRQPPAIAVHEAPPPLELAEALEVLQDVVTDVEKARSGSYEMSHPFGVEVRTAPPKGVEPFLLEPASRISEAERSVLSVLSVRSQGESLETEDSAQVTPVPPGPMSDDEDSAKTSDFGGGSHSPRSGASVAREISHEPTGMESTASISKNITFAADVEDFKEASRQQKGRGKSTQSSEMGHKRDNDSINLLAFEMLDCWKKNRQLAAKLGNKMRKPQAEELGLAVPTDSLEEDSDSDDSDQSNEHEDQKDIHRAKGKWKHVILHPNSFKRGVWEILSLLLVIYDIIWIPFQLFEPPASTGTQAMDWVTRLFWTFDIGMSFITGFVTSNGFIEMRPNKVVMRYARSWLSLDFVVVGVDWVEIFWRAAQGGGYFRFGRAARAFRIVRMVRLLRLFRIKEVVSMLFESVQSETIKEMSQMIKIVLLILMSGHLFACFWYGLGDANVASPSWPSLTFTEHDQLLYKYMASLHWSLAQYTGGMDEIRPVNVPERLYAIVVLTFTLMVGTVLVSSLTSSMTHLNFLANEKKTKMTMLRKYLVDNRITTRLTTRVQRNAQHALLEQLQYIPENHVELLQLVSEPLRIELHFELYAPILRKHPFFEEYIDSCPHIMHKVCHHAPSMVGVSAGDIIFNVGEIPPKPKMIIVTSGTLVYLPLSKLSGNTRQSTRRSLAMANPSMTGANPMGAIELEAGSWVAEPALWTHWMHRGILKAKSDARMCLVDAQRFQDQVTAFDHDEFNPKIYAAGYVDGLNKCDELTDLAAGIEAQALLRLQHHMDRLAEQKFVQLTSRGRRKASISGVATF